MKEDVISSIPQEEQDMSIQALLKQDEWDIKKMPIQGFCCMMDEALERYQMAYGEYLMSLSDEEFSKEVGDLDSQHLNLAMQGMDRVIDQLFITSGFCMHLAEEGDKKHKARCAANMQRLLRDLCTAKVIKANLDLRCFMASNQVR